MSSGVNTLIKEARGCQSVPTSQGPGEIPVVLEVEPDPERTVSFFRQLIADAIAWKEQQQQGEDREAA